MNISVKLLILGLVLVTLVSAQDFNKRFLEQESEEDVTSYNNFAQKFNRVFKTDSEFYQRFHIFKRNKKIVEELKLSDPENTFEITKFADMTEEEFESKYLNKNLKDHLEESFELDNTEPEQIKLTQNNKSDLQTPQPFASRMWDYFFPKKIDQSIENHPFVYDKDNIPDNFDWRDYGAINTDVYDQNTCGSCWSFTTCAVMEAQIAIRQNISVKLSEQQLLDCDKSNFQCVGGLMHNAYSFIKKNGGMQTYQSYGRYLNDVTTCHSNQSENVANIVGWKYVSADEETMKEQLVKYGPLAVGVNARKLYMYGSGVYSPSKCDARINHAVMIVGYGVNEKGKKYWTIKNTWGENWGEAGYFRLVRGKRACGVETYVTVPHAEYIKNDQ